MQERLKIVARLVYLSVMTIGAALSLAPHAFALSPEQLFRITEQSVLPLEVLDDRGKVVAAYSALVVDKGKVATQCDLLEGGATFRLVYRGGTTPAAVDKRDNERRLCLLSAAGLSAPAARIAPEKPPSVGASVYAVSNALALGTSITEGVVSGLREYKTASLIQFTAPIAPGSEGGGLFDSDGRLVGVIVYRPRDGQNINFALPARWLNEIGRRAASAGTATAWTGKALAFERDKNWAALAEHARKWTAADPESTDPWTWLGYAELSRGEARAAETAYREALKRDPTSLLATYGVVAALLAQGNSQNALEVARAMLSYRAEDGRLWTLIGAAEARLGHGDAAQDAFEKATRFEPWNRDALLGMADLALARKDWRRRVSMLRLLTQAMPDSSWTWVALSEAYLHVNQPSRALVSAEHALSVDPQSADALLWKGISLAAGKRQREAIDTINKSLQGKLHLPTWGWSALGQTYFDVKLYPESIAAYREAVKLAPEDKALRGSLGLVLKEGGYYAEALTVFEKLKSESPNDPFAWRQVCVVYATMAEPQKAIPACERSLEIDPAQPKVWYPLMGQYHAAGRRADVKRAYEKLSLLDRALSENAYRRMLLPYEGAP